MVQESSLGRLTLLFCVAVLTRSRCLDHRSAVTIGLAYNLSASLDGFAPALAVWIRCRRRCHCRCRRSRH